MELNYTLDNLDAIVETILKNTQSNLLLFYGEMGVGKTTLIKALVKSLGSKDDVQSPTYSLVNEYRTETKAIYHFDLYRLNDIEDVYNFGFEDYLNDEDYVLIEWPELVADIMPEDAVHIYLEMDEKQGRIMKLNHTKMV